MFTKENAYRAYFYTPERDQIEVLVIDQENPKKLIPVSVDVDSEDRMFQKLLEVFTLDQIEEMTKLESQARAEALREFHTQLIESGRAAVKLASDNSDEMQFEKLLDFFLRYDKETMEEALFNLKLAVFENDANMYSKSDKFKESIRKASTPLELIKILSNEV